MGLRSVARLSATCSLRNKFVMQVMQVARNECRLQTGVEDMDMIAGIRRDSLLASLYALGSMDLITSLQIGSEG